MPNQTSRPEDQGASTIVGVVVLVGITAIASTGVMLSLPDQTNDSARHLEISTHWLQSDPRNVSDYVFEVSKIHGADRANVTIWTGQGRLGQLELHEGDQVVIPCTSPDSYGALSLDGRRIHWSNMLACDVPQTSTNTTSEPQDDDNPSDTSRRECNPGLSVEAVVGPDGGEISATICEPT